MPEALAARDRLAELGYAGDVVCVTSPGLVFRALQEGERDWEQEEEDEDEGERISMDEELAAHTFVPFGGAEPFGLAAPLALATWCAAEDEPKPCTVTRGGASSCFPWPYCREWMLLLTAMEALP